MKLARMRLDALAFTVGSCEFNEVNNWEESSTWRMMHTEMRDSVIDEEKQPSRAVLSDSNNSSSDARS